MSVHYLPYQLHADGYVDNWLVAGPQAIRAHLTHGGSVDARTEIVKAHFSPEAGIGQAPREWEPAFMADGDTFRWRYAHPGEDHLVNLSGTYEACHYVRAWAAAELVGAQPGQVTLTLSTFGPADLWVNGQHAGRWEDFAGRDPVTFEVQAHINRGQNRVLVRFEQVALGPCPFAVALRVQGAATAGISVALPTGIKDIERRQLLAKNVEAAYLDRFVFAADEPVVVRWPGDLGSGSTIGLSFQNQRGWVFKEVTTARAEPGGEYTLMSSEEVTVAGAYQAVVRPWFLEYYEQNQRVDKSLPLHVLKTVYSAEPYGSYAERRQEALDDAARQPDDLFAEIAKMELGHWSWLNPDVILAAATRLAQQEVGGGVELVALLGLLIRYGSEASFPEALRQPLAACILGFDRWLADPEDPAAVDEEHTQILRYAGLILAGQHYHDRAFPGLGQDGPWLRHEGERLALDWMYARAAGGFRAWDSESGLAANLVALSHLAELAADEEVRDLAALLMDKVFLGLALNSHRGVLGSAQGRAMTETLQDGRLAATAGITRLMWGQGIFNDKRWGTVSLACCQSYHLPDSLAELACAMPEELWNCEHHGSLPSAPGAAQNAWEVNKVSYRTPDYLLSSAQDYRPGQAGDREHIWQATLGPAAVVFVNHPGNVSDQDACAPNFWCGNRTLPRVGQWHNTLVAIYRLPQDDRLGFTHAYYPVHAFEEQVIREGWAFACMGDGYLALTAARGLELVTHGPGAFRELRSYGLENTWLCHLGRHQIDGSFADFQESTLGRKLAFEALSVRTQTLRNETLVFGWEGPLMVNGLAQPLRFSKHYENPFCAANWPATRIQLDFGPKSLVLEISED